MQLDRSILKRNSMLEVTELDNLSKYFYLIFNLRLDYFCTTTISILGTLQYGT